MNAFLDELRIVIRDRTAQLALVLLIALTATALWNGRAFQHSRAQQAQAEVRRSIDKREADKAVLRQEAMGAMKPNPWGASEPTKSSWNAVRPPGPLVALSFGREDLEPLSANISLWMVREDNLFRKHELANSQLLAAGRFDAGFLIVLMLPLIVLALTYNVISDERESGRLQLALVQGMVWRRWALRLTLRLAPVFLCVAAIALSALAWGAPADRVFYWVAGAILYIALWSALAAALAALPLRAEMIALAGAALWVLLVVVLPSTITLAAKAIAPTPSAFAIINGARQASLDANRQLLQNLQEYVSDHPELMGNQYDDNDWAAKLYVSQRVIADTVAPVVADSQQRLEQQHAWISRLRFLSPATVLDDLMTHVAGTGPDRQLSYVRQSSDFLHRWQRDLSPLMFQRTRLTAEDIDRLPTFSFREPAVDRARIAASLLFLLLLTAALAFIARRRLMRTETQHTA